MRDNTIIRSFFRLTDTFRERSRWTNSTVQDGPLIYYGQRYIPNRQNLLSGGLVKLQDLTTQYPNRLRNPNILYLISSSLPPNPDIITRYAAKAHKPIVLNQNGVAYPAWHGPGWEITNRRLESVYKKATFVIFQSEFCKLSADKFLGPLEVPCTVLHNPVDTQQFTPPDDDQRPARSMSILIAGSHSFFYKIKTAIDTLSHLAELNVDCSLHIAGRCCWNPSEEYCREEIFNYSRSKGVEQKIRVSGAYTQTEACSIFQASDILLHPTYNDSCPRLVVEAMACGTPVVYSATGGTTELIPGSAGVGVPGELNWQKINPPDPTQLCKAIIAVQRDYKDFSRGAREHAIRNLDTRTWLQKHEQIFLSLLDNQTGQ